MSGTQPAHCIVRGSGAHAYMRALSVAAAGVHVVEIDLSLCVSTVLSALRASIAAALLSPFMRWWHGAPHACRPRQAPCGVAPAPAAERPSGDSPSSGACTQRTNACPRSARQRRGPPAQRQRGKQEAELVCCAPAGCAMQVRCAAPGGTAARAGAHLQRAHDGVAGAKDGVEQQHMPLRDVLRELLVDEVVAVRRPAHTWPLCSLGHACPTLRL